MNEQAVNLSGSELAARSPDDSINRCWRVVPASAGVFQQPQESMGGQTSLPHKCLYWEQFP